MKKPSSIMIHHSAVSYLLNSDQFTANNNYHRKTNLKYAKTWRFYKSSLGYYLGYSYEISLSGRVRQARQDGEETAACYQQRMNDGRCVHICIDGNFDKEKMAPLQVFALRDLMRKLSTKYSIKKESIFFHRDFALKTCPGKNVDINFIRNLIR